MEIINYLPCASLCMALSYLLYVLLFKRLTFFSVNRFYLLVIVATSLIIPVLHIKVAEPVAVQHIDQHFVPLKNGDIETDGIFQAPSTQQSHLNWLQIAGFAYSLICLVMLVKMFYGIFKVVRQARLTGANVGNNRVVENQNANNSSFFNIIFLRSKNADSLEIEQVLAHEKEHARLWHSADNLFIETVKAFFWFNPFIYFIANAIKEVHEFEVDHTLKNIYNAREYASLLIKLSSAPAISLTNQFSAFSLKARISMLFKPCSPAYKKCVYLLILPLLLSMGYAFSIEKVYSKAAVKKGFVLVLDAGHGGNETGSQGLDGRYEKDIALLAVKEIKLVAEQRGIRTILTRSDDRPLAKENRVDNKADAFISIHINDSYPHDKQLNGMMIMVSKNSLNPISKKLAVDVKTYLQQLKGINTDHGIGLFEGTQNIYILKHNKAPAILVELGYINNQNDMNYVLNPNSRHAIAEKIIDAVVAFGNTK